MSHNFNLNHITKIEGHASLSLKIEKNKVKKCELKTQEGARFFEALVLNKDVKDIQEIVSRICGICSSAHSIASTQALEEALGITPTQQQILIREMLMIGERIRSHITHLYFMVLPDYFNASSILVMKEKHHQKIHDAIEIISAGNKIVEIFGGREMHPFLDIKEKLPESSTDKIKLTELIKQLENIKPLIKQTIELFLNLKYPKVERQTDYLCLRNTQTQDYSTISGKVISNTEKIDDEDYKKHLKENIKEYAISKFVLKDNKPFVTGAMARINNNHNQIDNETKQYLKQLKLPLTNPYHNNIAQAIELLHLTNKAIKLTKISLTQKQVTQDRQKIKIKSGHAVSSTEAPRGTLFHEYKIDNQGKITYCNIITPTAQNLNMIELDIKILVENLLEKNKNKKEIIGSIEKLIRAYDPCFSCSSHFLRVEWDGGSE